MRVLQVGAEIAPWLDSDGDSGVADAMEQLPQALAALGADVRLLLPGLPPIVGGLQQAQRVCSLGPLFGAARIDLLCGRLPGSELRNYVLDAPWLYRRGGGPVLDPQGRPWADNAQRFALLGYAAAHLAAGELDADWVPQVVHAHDWQAALGAALQRAIAAWCQPRLWQAAVQQAMARDLSWRHTATQHLDLYASMEHA